MRASTWLKLQLGRIRVYRDEINSLQIQLSRTQAGPGRAVKEQQEKNSPNDVQRINLISVLLSCLDGPWKVARCKELKPEYWESAIGTLGPFFCRILQKCFPASLSEER